MILKYRAWNKKTQSFIDYGDLVLDLRSGKIYAGDIGLVESTIDVTDQIELMQSTGMKDKNGVESWEGNYLVKDGYWPFFIKWIESEGLLMAVPVNSIQRTNWKHVSVKGLLDTGYINDGNIYENPELLEEQ
ncbi:hypothetical protein D9Y92_07395 [Enterococcus faecium]|nr:hypothetical protein [Enterococcus faecium]